VTAQAAVRRRPLAPWQGVSSTVQYSVKSIGMMPLMTIDCQTWRNTQMAVAASPVGAGCSHLNDATVHHDRVHTAYSAEDTRQPALSTCGTWHWPPGKHTWCDSSAKHAERATLCQMVCISTPYQAPVSAGSPRAEPGMLQVRPNPNTHWTNSPVGPR
jgi:hypothetical protein